MGTRSAIGIKHGDVVKAVYCHWDGYLEHNGLILARFYDNSVKVNKLISMGDLSSLGASIGEQQDFNAYRDVSTLEETWCKFYKRDRGEENVDYRTFANEQDYLDNFNAGVEFHYLFKDGKWYYSDYGNEFTELEIDLIMNLLSKDEA
jgi:hypothetical protein